MEPRLEDYHYDLPPEFIAQTPIEPRDASKLLVIRRDGGDFEHRTFRELPEYLRPGDALVLNQTRVIPARLHARKAATGGAVELLLVERHTDLRWLALVGGKRMRVGTRLEILGAPLGAEIVEEQEEALRVVTFSEPIEPHLDAIGEAPLPPYIHHKLEDPERYQTVYARSPGSAAAPTAGLHFTPDLLLTLRDQGIKIITCTLHVGLGTFLPVKPEQVLSKRLHAEHAELSPEAARTLNETRLAGGRIVAVGTTSVRTLETAALHALGVTDVGGDNAYTDACPWKPVSAFSGSTQLFIMPGFRFRAVDVMITNFHLPQSSLLMLVGAFAGRERILEAYHAAKTHGYRFYSLGDACLIL
ncbi:MAG: tRNA preQ1(34) S-adenosylmethionine ribosyltransferase-isomerase QueA [Anaerolinea sp.]|nr:tRNA preQ1(34) S-adenosylmethionine ribosyltransferase-isomerase QueA [Anaerolinea sp.]